MSDSLRPHGLQHARPPCALPPPGLYPNLCLLSWWCHPTISSSVIPFSYPQSFPESGSFPMNQISASGDQSIGASASASVLPMNTQDWFPLGLTSWISLQSKGLSRVLPNTAVQKHQFFSAKLSLWPKSHIQHDYWKNHSFDQMDLCDYMDWVTKHSTVPIPAPQQSLWEVAYHSFGSPHSHLWGSLVV